MYAITINLSLGLTYLEGSKGLFKYQEVRGRARLHGREALHVPGSVCVCVLFAPVCHKLSEKESLDYKCHD